MLNEDGHYLAEKCGCDVVEKGITCAVRTSIQETFCVELASDDDDTVFDKSDYASQTITPPP